MDRIRLDLLHAIRSLRRTPGFAAVAVLSLALGIGASTAAFSLLNSLRLRALPYQAADRLVDLAENHPTEVCAGCGVGTSWLNYLDWRRNLRSFSGMAGYREDQAGVAFTAGAERRRVARITASMFPLLGVAALKGRPFSEVEEHGSAAVTLISEQLWESEFARSPQAIGSTVRIEGVAYEVIGVMPRGFAFPQFAELWLPLEPLVATEPRNERSIGVVARLRDGTTVESARTELTTYSSGLEQREPATQAGWYGTIAPLGEELAADYVAPFAMLLGALGFVLLITCANLATLMLARATHRQLEHAVRAALGASRGDLMRGLLLEALVLALSGGLLGLLIATWLIGLFRALPGEPLPRWVTYGVDLRVFGFAIGVSLLAALAIGLLPARMASKVNLHRVIKGTSIGQRRGWWPNLRELLVITQVAGAMMLVIGAGLFTKSFLTGQSRSPGYDTAGLMRADVLLPASVQTQPIAFAQFADAFLDELRRKSGARATALFGLHILNWPGTPPQEIRADGVTPEAATAIRRIMVVTPDYFATLGQSLRSGRSLSRDDLTGRPAVMVIGSTLADQLWPGQDPVGRQVTIGATAWTVVGVLQDPVLTGDAPRPAGVLYAPIAQLPVLQPSSQPLTLLLRTVAGATSIEALIRDAARSVNQDVVIEQVMSMDEFGAQWATPLRQAATIAASLGLFAALLAAIGIYGVMSYLAGQRTRELGIRVALGASRWRVTRAVLDRGVTIGLVGVIVGICLALVLTKFIQSQLYGVRATDPAVYALLGGLFLLVTATSAWLPARRASQVDPMVALRAD